ncbi:MAG: SpoIIE family protein phosphatase [Labilithrix sp.]|nr:SpoIIE family protein phosphatase [Labilithrix sp.]
MEALLIDEWLPDADAIEVRDEASLSLVRDRVRDVAGEAGIDAEIAARAALVATELGRNQLRHAHRGRIAVRRVDRGAHRGLEIVAVDRGGGIVDPARALEGTPRIHGSLGVGLASVGENASEVDYDVRVGEGTAVWARVLPREAPRRRQVGVYGRPFAGEPRSGDHAGFRRTEDALVVTVCDGLGHGQPAREASSAACAVFHAERSTSPADILHACHGALGPTRGAVMAVARLGEVEGVFEAVSVGNVAVQMCAPRAARRFGGSSAVLGAGAAVAKLKVESAPLRTDDVLIMASDGVSSRFAVEDDLDLLREHPIVIAQGIVTRFGRENDDVIVLVAK